MPLRGSLGPVYDAANPQREIFDEFSVFTDSYYKGGCRRWHPVRYEGIEIRAHPCWSIVARPIAVGLSTWLNLAQHLRQSSRKYYGGLAATVDARLVAFYAPASLCILRIVLYVNL